MRKTKIICTIGPACNNEETLRQMCLAGMNVARLNFSHGSHSEHQRNIDLIKKVKTGHFNKYRLVIFCSKNKMKRGVRTYEKRK